MARPPFSRANGGVKTLGPVTLAGAGALIAFAAATIKIRMPESGYLVGAELNLGARGGTHVTSAIDVQDDGVSVLTTPFDVDALTPGTPVEKVGAALTNSATGGPLIAKDSVISIILTEAGGTSPTYQAATVQLDYVPVGD